MFANLPAMGIMSGTQKDWILTYVAQFCAGHPKNSCTVLYMPNRAQDHKKEIVSKAKMELDAMADDDGKSDGGSSSSDDEIAEARAVTNDLLNHLTSKSMGLAVTQITLIFRDDSIHGKRRGFHQGVMVTAGSKDNIFTKSRLWRRGLVQNVAMLPRRETRRPRPLTKTEKGETTADTSMVAVVRQSMTPVQVKKQAGIHTCD